MTALFGLGRGKQLHTAVHPPKSEDTDLAGSMALVDYKTLRDSLVPPLRKALLCGRVSVVFAELGAHRQAQLSWQLPVQTQAATKLPPRPQPALFRSLACTGSKVRLSHQLEVREMIYLLQGAEIEVSQDTRWLIRKEPSC